MGDVLGAAIGQVLGLSTFVAFPALQYAFLKRRSRREGQPEVWYLPAYGFRIVIRNLPRTTTLSGIEYRALVRKVVRAGAGSSVATFEDDVLVSRSDFFLFPGNDQILLCFRLESSTDEADIVFVHTDKLGKPLKTIQLVDLDRVTCDYYANVENYFNFDVRLAKRAELHSTSLVEMWKSLQSCDMERRFDIDRIRNVG